MPMVGGNLVGKCPRCGAYGNSMSLCGSCQMQIQRERELEAQKLADLSHKQKTTLDPYKFDPFNPRRR